MFVRRRARYHAVRSSTLTNATGSSRFSFGSEGQVAAEGAPQEGTADAAAAAVTTTATTTTATTTTATATAKIQRLE